MSLIESFKDLSQKSLMDNSLEDLEETITNKIKPFEKPIKKIPKIKSDKPPAPLHSKQIILLESLKKFYTPQYKNIIVPIVRQETPISLRLLDWLVTNYSRTHDVRYELGTPASDGSINSEQNFNLHADYKNQLKAYSKKSFDPFCRRQRIAFNLETNEVKLVKESEYAFYNGNKLYILTTCGQLSAFRWFIVNKVIDYALDHVSEIESDMLQCADRRNKIKKGIKEEQTIVKRTSSNPRHQVKVVIRFD